MPRYTEHRNSPKRIGVFQQQHFRPTVSISIPQLSPSESPTRQLFPSNNTNSPCICVPYLRHPCPSLISAKAGARYCRKRKNHYDQTEREKVFALFRPQRARGGKKGSKEREKEGRGEGFPLWSYGATPVSRLSLDREKMSRPRQLGKIVSPSPPVAPVPLLP